MPLIRVPASTPKPPLTAAALMKNTNAAGHRRSRPTSQTSAEGLNGSPVESTQVGLLPQYSEISHERMKRSTKSLYVVRRANTPYWPLDERDPLEGRAQDLRRV